MEIKTLRDIIDIALSVADNEGVLSSDDAFNALSTFGELTSQIWAEERTFKQKLARLDAWYQVLQEKPTLENVVSVLSDVISSSRKEIADALRSVNSQKM
jgi:hypothetical protein